MNKLTLATPNIIALTKLEVAMRREYGIKFNLAHEDSLFKLLKLAAESSNPTILEAYRNFYDKLAEEEKKKLHTISIAPRSTQTQSISTSSEKTHSSLPEGVIKIVYRGSVIYKKDGRIIQDLFEKSANKPSNHAKRKPRKTDHFSVNGKVDKAE